MTKKIYPLLSGGIDSTLAILERIKNMDFVEFQSIFIDYNQKAKDEEWDAVCKVSSKIKKIINNKSIRFRNPRYISFSANIEKEKQVFGWSKSELILGNSGNNPILENRNMVLISIAASFVESQIGKGEVGEIITGFRDEFSDTKQSFVKGLNDLFTQLFEDGEKTIVINAPIIRYGKEGKKNLVKDYKEHKEIIEFTWSCYEPKDGLPCQKCDACKKRKDALLSLN